MIGDAAMVLLAAAGLMLLAGWLGRQVPRWVGLLMWWLGSGAMTAWAFYLSVLLLVPNDLMGLEGIAWADLTAQLVRVLAGLTSVVAGARMLAQADTPARVPAAA